MYRLIVLAASISVAHSMCQQSVPSQTSVQLGNPWANSFQPFEIAQAVIAIDRKMQSFCSSSTGPPLQEVYGKDHYQLSARIPDFAEDYISVKIMHRVIFVNANDCFKMYAGVQLLPEVVDPKRAVWKYWQGELVILIPYKASLNSCSFFIDESMINVPKMTTGVNGNCFVACNRSFGDGIIRDNVWHPSHSSGGLGNGGLGHGGFGQSNNNDNRGFIRNGVFGRGANNQDEIF